jgi:type IV pilus assembly protein PilC
MAVYRYSVKNQYGDGLKGRVEAQNPEQAVNILRSRGLLVVSVQPEVQDIMTYINDNFFGVKQNEVVNFTRQLSTMITAGLTLTESMTILHQQSTGPFGKVLTELLHEVEGGSSFAKALASHEKLFSPVYIQLVRAGETAGLLDNVLSRLAETLEKQKEFRAKTKGALIYPLIVIIVMLAVGFIMMVFVVPKLTDMYKELGADLPLLTRLLIGTSGFFASFWWLIIGLVVAGIVAFQSWYRTKEGHLTWDRFLLKMPVMGVLRQKIVLTEFCRTLGLLVSAGVSVLEALEILAKGVDNQVYQNAILDSRADVEKGIALSQSLSKFAEIPPILSQMIAVGEETGKLDEVLLKLSKYFESESEQAVKNLTTAFEPAIMITLGLGVGLLVVAIIMPIYNITASFN